MAEFKRGSWSRCLTSKTRVGPPIQGFMCFWRWRHKHFSQFLLSDVLSGRGENNIIIKGFQIAFAYLPGLRGESTIWKNTPKKCFFWSTIKLISNLQQQRKIRGSCLGIFTIIFCFLSFCFVLGLLSLKDIFIDFESASQSASRDNARLRVRQLTVPSASCLSVCNYLQVPKLQGFCWVFWNLRIWGTAVMKDFSVPLQFAVRQKKTLHVYVWWGCGGWAVCHLQSNLVHVLSNYAFRCFPNVSHGSYMKGFRGKFAVSVNGHRWLKCFMHTGKVKGQHVGFVWWRQECFFFQSLANLVPLNLIPTPTITELRITGVWSHRWVITGRSSHKTKRPRNTQLQE